MTQKYGMEDPNGKPLETKRRTSTKSKSFFQSLSDKYAFDEHFLYQLLEIKEEGQNKKF